MDLKNLPSRYTQISPADAQGADKTAAAMISDGVDVLQAKDLRGRIRPGFIDWNDTKEQVSFNFRPTAAQIEKSDAAVQMMVNPESKDDFLNGYTLGQTTDSSASTLTPAVSEMVKLTTPSPPSPPTTSSTPSKSHLVNKAVCAFIFIAIGIIICHIAHRKGWM